MDELYADYLRFVQVTGNFFVGWKGWSGDEEFPSFVTDYQNMFGICEALFV
ncbi:hypothetical protein ACFWVM_29215 [Nocardia fluminea]|uniref:hypothetical protein n=1 Tax=Nocardia TaxID=1817 RepID=UPI00364C90A2